MASPPKPWEKVGVNRQMADDPMPSYMSGGPTTPGLSGNISSGALPSPAIGGGDAPPAVPARPSSGYSSTYSPGYSSYNSYGGYGTPYSNIGPTTPGLSGNISSGALPSPAIGGGDAPPAVPARPSGYSSTYSPGYSSFNSYGGYGSPYSSMYSGGYSGGYGGMYGSPYSNMYGGGMYGNYNRFGAYGMNQNEFNSFARLAEESSRPAFQSIESIVGAFSSVSMMLDSTFQAVYNSFRAVVGVADNFGRMKTQFAQIFAALAVFKWLKYLYRKLLVFLRLRPSGFAEEAWQQAGDVLAQSAAASAPGGKKTTWPVIMFFAIIMGGPWLIWKFLQATFSSGGKKTTWPVIMFFTIIMGGPWLIWKFLQATFSSGFSPGWANGSEDHFVASALYDFSGQGNDELSFNAGATIHVAPKEVQPKIKGWLLASVDGKQVGLIPANYVKVLGKRRGTNYTNNQSQIQSNQQSQGVPNVVRPQTGPQISDSNTSQNMNPTLNQSPSAIDFQNDVEGNIDRDSYTNQELDSIFNTGASVPSAEENGDKS